MCIQQPLSEAFFGSRPEPQTEPKPEAFKYTPVELPRDSAVRMRVLELIMTQGGWEDIGDLLDSAEKLEEFVKTGTTKGA